MKTAQDIQKETYDEAWKMINQIEELVNKSRMTKDDKFWIYVTLRMGINNILNTAFDNEYSHNYLDEVNVKNGIMPENYITPKNK